MPMIPPSRRVHHDGSAENEVDAPKGDGDREQQQGELHDYDPETPPSPKRVRLNRKTVVRRKLVASKPDPKRQRSEMQGSTRPSFEYPEESSSKRSHSDSSHIGEHGSTSSRGLRPGR